VALTFMFTLVCVVARMIARSSSSWTRGFATSDRTARS
jgi:hypothetical protein